MSNAASGNTTVKPYDKLEFRDSFVFGHVMEDPGLCREVLECLLQRPIGELQDIVRERDIKCTSGGKAIRLDIYVEDDKTVYDAEMQNLNKKTVESLHLPKRSRYYQAAIDIGHIDKGGNYRNLPESVILFICTFDPFGKNLSQYTFYEKCEEAEDILLEDGTMKIFFNCCYNGNDVPDGIRKLYNYIVTGKAGNDMTERLDDAVRVVKRTDGLRAQYYKELMYLEDVREEVREEEQKKTEAERKRADAERKRADDAEAKIKELKRQLAEVKKKKADRQ